MGIRAPWKGWLRVAMPIVSSLILANTIAILTLAVFNAATIDLYSDEISAYLATHGVLVRAQLVLFWCVVPFVYLIVTTCEHFCLWTDRLSAIWILVSSVVAIGAWVTQIVLWPICIRGPQAPDFCPWVYKESWGRYPSWSLASPWGAPWAVPTIFVLYLTQIAFAAVVINRQRRTSFRKSDLRQSWAGKLEEEESQSSLVGLPAYTPQPNERRPESSVYSIRPDERRTRADSAVEMPSPSYGGEQMRLVQSMCMHDVSLRDD